MLGRLALRHVHCRSIEEVARAFGWVEEVEGHTRDRMTDILTAKVRGRMQCRQGMAIESCIVERAGCQFLGAAVSDAGQLYKMILVHAICETTLQAADVVQYWNEVVDCTSILPNLLFRGLCQPRPEYLVLIMST